MLWFTLEEFVISDNCLEKVNHHNHVTLAAYAAAGQLETEICKTHFEDTPYIAFP